MGPALRAAAALALLALSPGVPLAVTPGVPAVRTLPNGLTVVLLEDHTLPLAAVSLWIHAGSKDEIETSAGYAHFLEHLIQRGTDTVGPFVTQQKARRWGGSLTVRSNYDRTVITLTGIPAGLQVLIEAAAGMGLGAALKDSEIDLELGPLSQEIKTYYDEPASVAFLETLRATFPGHPYRVPMLGNFRTLGTLKHDPLASFYRNLYVPNNMALAIVGDFEAKTASSLVDASFGGALKSVTLPPKPPPPAAFVGHKDIVREKRLDLRETSANLSFAGPGYRSPDRAAFEVLTRALGEAAGAPLQAAVVRENAGASARVSYYGLEDAGMLYVTLAPSTPQLSYAAATAALQEIVAFKKRGLKEPELRALVEVVLREDRMGAERLADRAEALGEAALFGGIRYYWDRPEIFGRLTPADIARVAGRYLVGDNVRLVLILPKDTPPLGDEAKDRFHAGVDQLGGAPEGGTPGFDRVLYAGEEGARIMPTAWGNPRDAAGLKPPETSTLGNGVTLIVQEDHRNSLGAIALDLEAGSADDPPGKEGLASLVGRLVASGAMSGARARAARTADRLSSLPDVQVSRDLTEIHLIVSPSGLRAGLSMLADAIRRPPVDDATIALARKTILDALDRGEHDPATVAQELFREKVYAGRPYAHAALGNPSALQSLTRDDVARFQAARVRPTRTVLAVAGDVAAGDVARLARELFGDWREETGPADGGNRPASGGIDPQAGAAPRTGEFARTLPASQSFVILGGSGAPVASPDFETLRLIGTHLTLQAFDDMVFKRRAAFGATAIPEGLRDAGSLAIEVVAPHGRREEAVFDLQRLMRNLTIAETSGEDIETASRVQAGREAQALQGVAALAATLAYREAAGLGAASYRDELAPPRPSPARIKAAAERYLRPESWIVVKVGPPAP